MVELIQEAEMSVETLEQSAPIEPYNFTLNDRCDSDDGVNDGTGRGINVAEQAYHRWTKDDKEVFLCNHHNKQHEDYLISNGWKVESSPYADNLHEPLDVSPVA